LLSFSKQVCADKGVKSVTGDDDDDDDRPNNQNDEIKVVAC